MFYYTADLICRNCGRKIANEEAFIDVKSNKALKSFNTTILGLKTLVHIFENQVRKSFFCYFIIIFI